MHHHAPTSHDTPTVVYPGYLAGPGQDLDTLFEFGRGRDDWLLTVVDDHLVASHESASALVVLNRATDSPDPRWTISSSRGPLRDIEWYATFDAPTPAEIVMAVARRLAHGMSQPTHAERDRQLWSHACRAGTPAALHTEAARSCWTTTATCCARILDAPDGTATLRLHPSPHDPGDIAYTLSAGARGHQESWWTAQFSSNTPTAAILAALRTVTDPGRYTRRASQIPMLHRSLLRTHPVARPRPEPARAR